MATGLVRCDDVVVWNIARERGSDQPTTGQLSGDEILTRLSDKFVFAALSHSIFCPKY